VVQVVTGFEEGQSEKERNALQSHSAWCAFQNLYMEKKIPHETLVKLGAYLIGEFGHFLPDNINPRNKFEALTKHFHQVSADTKAILLLATVKLLNANPHELRKDVFNFLEELKDQQEVELQQRACELSHLITNEELFESVLAVMPAYTDAVQQNNPLIQRLKFHSKNRAHTRSQLEDAAKSEGGIYKPGAGKKRRSESSGH
jgi:AP-2 complex subunit alpha